MFAKLNMKVFTATSQSVQTVFVFKSTFLKSVFSQVWQKTNNNNKKNKINCTKCNLSYTFLEDASSKQMDVFILTMTHFWEQRGKIIVYNIEKELTSSERYNLWCPITGNGQLEWWCRMALFFFSKCFLLVRCGLLIAYSRD